MYVDYNFYKSLYGNAAVDETEFNRFCWVAQKKIDSATTGIDGVKKLKIAFPTNEDDAETVKRCVCAILSLANDIEQATKRISTMHGYVENADGTIRGKVISSVSAGSESITYSATGTSEKSLIDVVITDKAAQEKLYFDTIREFLSGVKDKNGINLLYMGKYPYVEV